MIAPSHSTLTLEDLKISHADIAYHYLGINKIPCLICSPLRRDNSPSLSLFTKDGVNIFYKDHATKESGNIITLLKKHWHCSYQEVIDRISTDIKQKSYSTIIKQSGKSIKVNTSSSNIEVVFRQWEDHDISYWKDYGITIEALIYSDVYPISHIYFIKEEGKTLFHAEKYAYVYIEHKDFKTTYKIYQPFSKRLKWLSKHDASVISLWTKIPEKGEKLIIASSLKDALCIWCNTSIPAIALQGEGYMMSNTAISELKKRYKNIYILFDNDEAGIKHSHNLAEVTGFTCIELPKINNQKDVSDIYKSLEDKQQIKQLINNLL